MSEGRKLIYMCLGYMGEEYIKQEYGMEIRHISGQEDEAQMGGMSAIKLSFGHNIIM